MYPKHSPQRGTSSAPMGTNLSVSADPIPVAGASGMSTQPQGRPADSLIEAVSGVRRSDGLIIVPRATPLRCGIVFDIVIYDDAADDIPRNPASPQSDGDRENIFL